MKKIYFVIIAGMVFASCQEKHYGAFKVSGTIAHAPSNKIYLEQFPFGANQPVVIDSSTIQANGNFELKGMAKEEGVYSLDIQNGPGVLLVNDGNDIRVKLDIDHYKDYTTEGSQASTSLHELFGKYELQYGKTMQAYSTADSLQKASASDSMLSIARVRKNIELKRLNSLLANFVQYSSSPAASLQVLGMAQRTMNGQDLLNLVEVAANKFKNYADIASLQKQLTSNRYPLLNKTAPDITLTSSTGDTVSLSSYRGKYVLVDFWASWCGPCRQENPNVVSAYKKFKDKNFTVIGVSLDDDKQAWLDAIKKDSLTWAQVSDLKKWNSPLVDLYHFTGIPFNVLIDPQGKIIANELRGDALDEKLGEVLK